MDETSAVVAKPIGGLDLGPKSVAPPAGSVDLVSAAEIVGWVWDQDRPETSVEVELLDGESVIASVAADIHRPDLEAAGIGTGRYGFRFLNVGQVLPRLSHRLRLRRASDGMELLNSPSWLINREGQLESEAYRVVTDLMSAAVAAASEGQSLSKLLDLFIDGALQVGEKQKLLRSSSGDPPPNSLIGRLREQFPMIVLPESEAPIVSIIIPVHNKFAVTYNCLKSISENLPEAAFEIIIVDDGSSDETLLATLLLPDSVRLSRSDENVGFIASCNRGAQLARSEYLFFLNNDTLVRPDWLDPLIATMRGVDRAGIVGARLLFPDGKVQDAGGLVWRMGDAWNWGRGADAADPRFTFMRDVDYVTGAALLISRELFRSLGGFDVHFSPAYYEDTDLAFRVRAAGRRVLIQPAAEIVHLEGVSSGTDTAGSGAKRYQKINQAKFFRRWRKTLTAHRVNGQKPELEAERAVAKRAYFIDDTVPTPDMDAGSRAALEHMLALMKQGYKVIFIGADNMARIDPYTRELEIHGIECVYFPYYWSAEQVFRAAAVPVNLVYIHRYANALKYAGIARSYFPNCPIVYSVADLHFVRMQREAALTRQTHVEREAANLRERDLAAMRIVDSVIVHSHYEAELLRNAVPELDVHEVGWTIAPIALATPIAQRRGVAFVGGYQHRPNVDAAEFLVREIVPALQKHDLSITCHLAGSRMPAAVAMLGGPGVEVEGHVPDLRTLFERVRCTVAPLRYGAGVKGKVLDSFAYGLPCVMSKIAAEGLKLPEPLLWLVAQSPEEFADKIAALHQNLDLATSLADAGRRYIESSFGAALIQRQLGEVISAASARRSAAVECQPVIAS